MIYLRYILIILAILSIFVILGFLINIAAYWILGNIALLIWNFFLLIAYVFYFLWIKLAKLAAPLDNFLWVIPNPIVAWGVAGFFLFLPIGFILSALGLKRSHRKKAAAFFLTSSVSLSVIAALSLSKDKQEYGMYLLNKAKSLSEENRYLESVEIFKLAENVLLQSEKPPKKEFLLDKWKTQLSYFDSIGQEDTITIQEARQTRLDRNDSLSLSHLFAQYERLNYAIEFCPDGESFKSQLYFRLGTAETISDSARRFYTLAIENQKNTLLSKLDIGETVENENLMNMASFYLARSKTYSQSNLKNLTTALKDCDSALFFYKDYEDAISYRKTLIRNINRFTGEN